jgi:hypothetical protein
MKKLCLVPVGAIVLLTASCRPETEEAPEAHKPPPAVSVTASVAAVQPVDAGSTIAASVLSGPSFDAGAVAAAGAAELAPLSLPPQLQGKAVVIAPSDPDASRADLASAVKPAGEGGITQGLVVRLTADIPVWRLWSGPTKKDASGRDNRMGQWWGYDAPHGTQAAYRTAYEICMPWNDLTWVAKCTLKAGAVVAIGPGNSVSAKVCGDPTGKEAYPVNTHDWQIWISKIWERGKEIVCPAETLDYEDDAADIAHAKKKTRAVSK